jgi:uncharacterized phage-associated protein
MIEIHTIIEVIYYILNKIGPADKLKLVKLIYLADKCHLIRYGRTITNDDYYAMEHGPVGTTVKDFLSDNSAFQSSEENKFESKLIQKIDEYKFKCKQIEYKIKWLSQSDIEILDFIIKEFGSLSSGRLIEYTHNYPEWKNNATLFKNRILRRKRIENFELLSILKNDKLAMPKEHIAISEEILSGKTN